MSASEKSSKKPSGLGRGLSSLLGDLAASAPAPAANTADANTGPLRVAIAQVIPNPRQPRRHFAETALAELADSIREKGILQPILVRPSPDQPGSYEIVAGERRWRAAQRVPLHEVPVVVRTLDDGEVLELALIENIQRQDLTPIEEAEGYRRLITDFQYTQEKLSAMVGKSRSHVANMMRLLDLPTAVQSMVTVGALSMGHARALISTSDPERVAEEIVRNGLSVRQVEQLVKSVGRKPGARPVRAKNSASAKDADTLALERDISATLGMPVSIHYTPTKGTVTITYVGLDQLDALCQRLCLPAGRF